MFRLRTDEPFGSVALFRLNNPLLAGFSGIGSKETLPALAAAERRKPANALEYIAPASAPGITNIGTAALWTNHDWDLAWILVESITSIPEIRGVPRARL